LSPWCFKPSPWLDEGEEGVPFAVEYEHRSSDKFDRMEVIDIFAGLIKSPPHKVRQLGRISRSFENNLNMGFPFEFRFSQMHSTFLNVAVANLESNFFFLFHSTRLI